MASIWDKLMIYLCANNADMMQIKKIFLTTVDSMAPQAKVSVVDAINSIKKLMLHFTTNEFPAYTSEVWKLLSRETEEKRSAHNFYINVREDRRQILSLARHELGIVISSDENVSKEAADIFDLRSGCENKNDADVDSAEDEVRYGSQKFVLLLTQDEWAIIKPKQKDVGKLCLTPWVWTNVISIAFWRQHKLPCAFIYRRADVTTGMCPDTDDTKNEESVDISNESAPRLVITHLIKIEGRCRSRECGNVFTARAEINLDDEAVMFHVNTRDTRKVPQDDVKRPFNGKRRREAYTELIAEGAAVWRKRQARENMAQGDIEPSFLPSGKVLRVAKQEAVDSEMDVNSNDGRDLMKTVEYMSSKPEFCGVINAVSSFPFYVFYMTPAQLHTYKEYCRLKKRNCTISIDATGSLVQKLNQNNGIKSGHIFLYVIVINFENTTLPVYQMLSMKHETELIEFWIKKWIRLGAPKPREAVCDYSRALISAMCLAFNNITMKTYINNCFARLYSPRDQVSEYPSTLIRIDVSHLIHLVCRWKSLKTVTHPQVKDFYVRCVALLVDCRSLDEFKNIFTLTCSVRLQVYEDVETNEKLKLTAKDARKQPENRISVRNIDVESAFIQAHDKVRTEMDDTTDFVEHTTSESMIGPWIENLVSKGKGCAIKGTDLNAFYLPDFITSLTKLAKEFPLWTAVMVPHNVRHATSSSVEGYFSFVKSQVCKNFRLPIRVDKFLTLQVRDVIGENFLFSSKLTRCIPQSPPIVLQSPPKFNYQGKLYSDNSEKEKDKNPNEDDTGINKLIASPLSIKVPMDDSDLKSRENWRAKASQENYGDVDMGSDEESILHPRTYSLSATEALSDHSYCKIEEPVDENILCDRSYKDLDIHTNDEFQNMLDHKEEILKNNKCLNSPQCAEVLDVCTEQDYEDLDIHTNDEFQNMLDHKEEILKNNKCLSSPQCAEVLEVCTEQDNRDNGTRIVKDGKYFRAFPETRQRNANLTRNMKKGVLIPNGLIRSRPIKIDNKSVFLRKTCPFDSIMHILMTSCIDDQHYASIVEQSKNPTLQLVLKVITTGSVTKDTLQDRGSILSSFYGMKPGIQTATRCLSYTLDAEDSMANTVSELLQSEPRVKRRIDCSRCGIKEYPVMCISPNSNIIVEKGFGAMERALAFRHAIYKMSCTIENCGGQYTMYNNANCHLFIELDVRGGPTWTSGLSGKLRQLPVTIKLGGKDELEKEYRLTGIVGYQSGHFIAYCRRSSGVWQEYNDLSNEILTCDPNKEIVPHLAVYIRNHQEYRRETSISMPHSTFIPLVG